jgi:hypothetical protein
MRGRSLNILLVTFAVIRALGAHRLPILASGADPMSGRLSVRHSGNCPQRFCLRESRHGDSLTAPLHRVFAIGTLRRWQYESSGTGVSDGSGAITVVRIWSGRHCRVACLVERHPRYGRRGDLPLAPHVGALVGRILEGKLQPKGGEQWAQGPNQVHHVKGLADVGLCLRNGRAAAAVIAATGKPDPVLCLHAHRAVVPGN